MANKNSPSNKIAFTDEMREFVVDHYNKMTNQQLADALGVKVTWLRIHIYAMGLKRQNFEYFTAEQVDFLKVNYVFYGNTELAEIFNIMFPRKIKPWTIDSFEKKLGYLKLKRTKQQLDDIRNRYVKLGRFADGSKKAWSVRGVMQVGQIKVWRQNDKQAAYIKTEFGFMQLSRYLWELHYGKIPKNKFVVLNPGAPVICSIDDLELIDQVEHCLRNSTSNRSIVRRCFREKDEQKVNQFIEQLPQLIDVKRKQILLNYKINQYEKTIANG